MVMVFYLILVAVLLVAAYFGKRKFGMLGLALATGSVLSGIWGYDAGLVVGALGIRTSTFTSAIAVSVVILLPSVILMFGGHRYKSEIGRIVGASMFVLLAVAFLIEPLSHVLVYNGPGLNAYNWLFNNRQFIIGVGLTIAVVELFLAKPAHLPEKHHKKH